MNYAALQARVRSRLNISTDDPISSAVPNLVNDGLHWLESASPQGWSWQRVLDSFSTIVGASSYAFPVILPAYDIVKILGVKLEIDNAWLPLDMVSPEEAWMDYPSQTRARPESYFVEGQVLYLVGIPDAVYDLEFRAVVSEPELVSDSDEPLMPAVFHRSIVDAALTLAYQTLQDSSRADFYEKLTNVAIERMKRYSIPYMTVGAPMVREQL